MKVYKCDSCDRIAEMPNELEMKEFLFVCDYELRGVFPKSAKRKVKIHLCKKCFKSLSEIADKKLREVGE